MLPIKSDHIVLKYGKLWEEKPCMISSHPDRSQTPHPMLSKIYSTSVLVLTLTKYVILWEKHRASLRSCWICHPLKIMNNWIKTNWSQLSEVEKKCRKWTNDSDFRGLMENIGRSFPETVKGSCKIMSMFVKFEHK